MGDNLEDSGISDRAWFKPAVAAWFALLLGGGLWFMPPRVHDCISAMLGLDRMLPLFAAPMGTPGKAILCAALALLGAMLGWAIAARLARPPRQKALTSDVEPVAEVQFDSPEEDIAPRRRRVLSAREDIGEEGIPPALEPAEETETEAQPETETEATAPEEQDFEPMEAVIEIEEGPSFDAPIIANEPEAELEAELDAPETAAEFVPLAEDWASDPEPDQETEVLSEQGEEDYLLDTDGHEQFAEFDEEQEAEPLGDMSLDSLLARLEGALDTRRETVEKSERAARQPALQPVPLANAPIDSEALERMVAHAESGENDPIVTFLQREADRRLSQPDEAFEDAGDEAEAGPRDERTRSAAHSAVSKMLDRMGLANRHD